MSSYILSDENFAEVVEMASRDDPTIRSEAAIALKQHNEAVLARCQKVLDIIRPCVSPGLLARAESEAKGE